jgi:2,4-dienoyl-CoA reductase (NADPH2)
LAQAEYILATPIQIGNRTLANRIVMGPMAAHAARPDGGPSEQTIAFFEARAKGGVGMIIVGGCFCTWRGIEEAQVKTGLRFIDEKFIPEFRRMAEAVHAYNTPIIGEMVLGFGPMAMPTPERPNIASSPTSVTIPEERFPRGVIVPGGVKTPMTVEATIEQIKLVEQDAIQTAINLHKAGWDGVEVAAHMSYFAATFLSPRYNKRTDEYGGSAENRGRLLANVVAGVRKAIGKDFIVGLRITANDYMPNGQGAAEFAAVAKAVEKAGIDYVALSTGAYETIDASVPLEDGILVDSGDAKIFKDVMSVPVIIQGIHDPVRAAKAVAEGHGDLAMFARPMLADAEFAKKALEGRPETITKCIRDHHCMRRMLMNMPVRCEVNPQMGRESRKGAPPPLGRLIQAPIESAVLAITSSRPIVKFAMSLKKQPH